MSKKSKTVLPRLNWNPVSWLRFLLSYAWRGGIGRKILSIFIAAVILLTGIFYGIAEWYIRKHNSEPLVLGTTFISDYAEGFGLDPNETLEAIFSDLGIKQIRLVSYWKEIEATPGKYDFSALDQQFELAKKYNVKVSLAIGMRQPRWPECHEPKWITIAPETRSEWEPKLLDYMKAVVDRYKDNSALSTYELENEFFMEIFGECKDFSKDRLIKEFQLVKQWDPKHPIIISRSNNWIGIPVSDPVPDRYAISVYKRVWDATFTKRYFEYPLPPWFYAALAGAGELWSGKDMIIHELQAEPWAPNGKTIPQISVAEQFKSMSPERMKKRIEYGKNTGMRTIDLWGAEWWYWLKKEKGEASIWNTVKEAVAQAESDNQKLK